MRAAAYHANQMAKRGCPIEQGELVQLGIIGAYEAVGRWDPARGKLSTFVDSRIRGSMKDAMRRLDWVPASARESDTAPPTIASLHHSPAVASVTTEDASPAATIQLSDEVEYLLAECTAVERGLLDAIYVDGLSFRQAGERLAIPTTTVFELHAAAMDRIRRRARSSDVN